MRTKTIWRDNSNLVCRILLTSPEAPQQKVRQPWTCLQNTPKIIPETLHTGGGPQPSTCLQTSPGTPKTNLKTPYTIGCQSNHWRRSIGCCHGCTQINHQISIGCWSNHQVTKQHTRIGCRHGRTHKIIYGITLHPPHVSKPEVEVGGDTHGLPY